MAAADGTAGQLLTRAASETTGAVGTTGMNVLRFTTCGSVDDGKSSLIGRILYDLGAISDDQLAALARDSRTYGSAATPPGSGLDLALLVDGLESEREQGITIDVAYRYFATARRKFIVADTPGHEQYTRNMATGASVSDLAVVLVDARKGLGPQTRRHAIIAHLLGVRHVVLAVNKMDLVGFDAARFTEIAAAFQSFATALGITEVAAIPLSALTGSNVVHRGDGMPWYRGPTLIERLEAVDIADHAVAGPLRLPVQIVLRDGCDFRGYAGQIAAGSVRPGDEVVIAPSGGRTSSSAGCSRRAASVRSRAPERR